MPAIKAIIFDCFNVLVADATHRALADLQELDPAKREEFSAVTHAVDKGIITDIEAAEVQSSLMGMSIEAFIALRNDGEVRNEQLITFIQSLKGKYKLGMVSNINSRERLDSRFLPGQLDELFDVVVPSGEVGYIKPQPEIFELAAAKLGVLPTECVFIDDIAEFCEGARVVGMQAIQFISTNQAISGLTTLIDRGGEKD
jgi:putative hydrolase of the HAD superfamily